MVQAVFVGEAHRAVNLMRDFRADAGRFPHAGFGGRNLVREPRRAASGHRAVAGAARRRDLSGEHGQVVLHGLELGDGAAELLALGGVGDGLVENAFECAGHQRHAGESEQFAKIIRHGNVPRAAQRHFVARFAGDVGVRNTREVRAQLTVQREHLARRPRPRRHAARRDGGESLLAWRADNAREQDFRQRQRRRVASGHLQHAKQVRQAGTGARRAHQVQAGVVEPGPKRTGKLACFGGVQRGFGHMVGEQALGGLLEQPIHQRNPNLFGVTTKPQGYAIVIEAERRKPR